MTVAKQSGDHYDGEERSIVLMSRRNNPGAPQILEAKFGYNPSKIYVSFDTPTDKGADYISNSAGNFPCSELFTNSTPGLSVASCLWTSNSEVTITLGSGEADTGSNANIGDTLTLIDHVIKPCSSCCPMSTQPCPASTDIAVKIQSQTTP